MCLLTSFLLMTILSEALFSFVGCNLMSLSLLTARQIFTSCLFKSIFLINQFLKIYRSPEDRRGPLRHVHHFSGFGIP